MSITRRSSLLVLVAIAAVWLVLQSLLLPPVHVEEHWRQAETASMALNLAHRDFDPWLPQINWGGDGPGYVEAELPLYQALVGALMLVFGDSPWTGMAVSLSCVLGCAVVVCNMLGRTFGASAGLVGGVYVLTSRLGVHLSAAMMPDALAVLFYVIALDRFVVWVEFRRLVPLLCSAGALAVAACIKPTALGLGIAEFLVVVAVARETLKTPWVWLAWLTTLVFVGVWLVHGADLQGHYGNSFGVIAGGDSKFPTVAQLFERGRLIALARVSVEWGIGAVPLLLGMIMMMMRRWTAFEWSLATANLVVLFVSMRYATLDYAGGHYHMFAMIFAAWLVAKAYGIAEHLLRSRGEPTRLLVVATAGSLCVAYGSHVTARRREDREASPAPIVELGHALADRTSPDTLVVAQSDDDAWDPQWQRFDNYQDPRLFYASHTRGWVLAHDLTDPAQLAEFADRGARFYVVAGTPPPALVPWLSEHARIVYQDHYGTIYRLVAEPPR